MKTVINKANQYIHSEVHTSKRLSRGVDTATGGVLRLSDEVVKGIDSLPDKLPPFIDNAMSVWKECGCPWFYSSTRRRDYQKGASIRLSTFQPMATEMTRHRLSMAAFTDEIVYQYLYGASDELKEVVSRLKAMYSADEELVRSSINITRAIYEQFSRKVKDENLINDHVIGYLIRAWVDCGSPKPDVSTGGYTVITKVSLPKSFIEPWIAKCREVGISRRKLVDALLLAWVQS